MRAEMMQPGDKTNTGASLGFWSVLDVLYGLTLTFVLLRFVPWKWPAANVAMLAYLAAHVGGAPGLWRQHLWAWRLAVITSLVGVAMGVIAVAGLLLSWSYLRGVYGSFGQGASLVSLLLAATAFQVLSLYSALRLRALLAARGGWRAGIRLTLGSFVVTPLVLALVVHARFAMAETAPVQDADAQALLLRARQCLAAKACDDAEKQARIDHERRVYLSLFLGGRAAVRAEGNGDTWSSAVASAARDLLKDPKTSTCLQGRLKLDFVREVSPLPLWPQAAHALGFDPGHDGLRVRGRLQGPVILPDDLITADVVGAAPLLPFLHEVRLGVGAQWLREQLHAQAGDRIERFAVESFIECNGSSMCKVDRGVVRLDDFDARTAAIRAGQFIVRAQKPDGTFAYVYRPWTHTAPPSGYSLARHAGTAYALAMLEILAPGHGFGDSSARSLAWLLAQAGPACGGRVCVHEGGIAKVGTNSLTLLALATYQKATGDVRWLPHAQAFAQFLDSLMAPSGDLVPAYDLSSGRPAFEMPRQMFATEEAAMAFAAAGSILHDDKMVADAKKTLHFLTTEKYADFLGRFMYGVDSWTCMAVAELPQQQVKPSLIDFCLGYADFLQRMQFSSADRGNAFEGHYGFSHVLIPQAPAAAGFAEALTAVLAVARAHRRHVPELEKQVADALKALARDQLRPGNDYLAADPPNAWGGIRRSVVESEVRIDFVQHAASAFARGNSLGIH